MSKKGIEHDRKHDREWVPGQLRRRKTVRNPSIAVTPGISFLSEAAIRRAVALILIIILFIVLAIVPRIPLQRFFGHERLAVILVILFAITNGERRVEVVCLLGIVLFRHMGVKALSNRLFLTVLGICVSTYVSVGGL